MDTANNIGSLYIHTSDLIALPFYLIIIYLIASRIKRKRIGKNPLYKYYIWGLFAKIGGGIAFVMIYLYYWSGGDTTAYFDSAVCMNNLLMKSPYSWFLNEFGGNTYAHYTLFTDETGYPSNYMYFHTQTYTVIQLVNPLLLLSFNSFLLTTVILDCVAFAGIWRLFLTFSYYYPKRKHLFAFAILFFPSVVFWASGILKDTITLSSTCWVVFCIHKILTVKKKKRWYIFTLFINIFFIFLIKPYIIIALLPGALFWMFASRIVKIQNSVIRFMTIPLLILLSGSVGYGVLSNLSSYMGKYALGEIAHTALATQNDLKQDYYHGHKFDIGFSNTSTSEIIRIFPSAFMAGIYRPYLWESANIVMLISGLENLLLLILTITSIVQTNFFDFFRKISKDPVLLFSLTFSVFSAFSVGVTTANFGALVRFKVAYIPFFLCSLFMLIKRREESPEYVHFKEASNSIRLKPANLKLN